MSAHHHGPDDQQLEASVARLLLFGVLLATAIVLVGAVIYLAHPLQSALNYRVFHATEPALRSLGGTWHGAFQSPLQSPLQGRSRALIQLGIMVLIATPIARVALCLLGFARQRDKLYAIISATVLVILLYSLVHPV